MPNRVLRDWTTSEAIESMSFEGEVFFTRLIMKADDHGNYTANPKLLKAALFPLRDVSPELVESWLGQCIRAGVVRRYEVDGKQYINIPNFGQRLRQMRSSYPQPADNPLTTGGQPADNRRPETKRNEVESESETENVPFDELFLMAFDEITCERLKMTFKEIPDLGRELQLFRTKCDNAPEDYHKRDISGLRLAFQYQLKNYKHGKGKRQTTPESLRAAVDKVIREQGIS